MTALIVRAVDMRLAAGDVNGKPQRVDVINQKLTLEPAYGIRVAVDVAKGVEMQEERKES